MPRPDPVTLRTRRRAAVGLAGLAVVAGVVLAMGWVGSDADVATRTADGPSTTVERSTTTEPGGDGDRSGHDGDRDGPLEPTAGSPAPTGAFTAAPGAGPVVGAGPLRSYVVEVEDGIGIDPGALAAEVERVLGDPRGWTADGAVSLQRVPADQQPSFRVVLAAQETTDRLCAPLQTNGIFSCHMDGRAVLNLYRWIEGAGPSGLDLPDYRTYVINHEVGHALGRGHVGCPGSGLPAPVMMQQTKGIGACAPNPWPHP